MSTKTFMMMAEDIAEMATCDRAKCGTVLAKDGNIISIGFNGPALHAPGGCKVVDNHCVNSVHSEVRAITAAARQGHSTLGATAYLNQRPCQSCLAALDEAGIEKVWYLHDYHSSAGGDRWVSPELMDHLDVQQFRG